jgi:hypothetical protein
MIMVYIFRRRSGFDKGNLEWLEQLFRQTVGNEKEIRRDDFKKILITKNVSNLQTKHFYPEYNSSFNLTILVSALLHGASFSNFRQR